MSNRHHLGISAGWSALAGHKRLPAPSESWQSNQFLVIMSNHHHDAGQSNPGHDQQPPSQIWHRSIWSWATNITKRVMQVNQVIRDHCHQHSHKGQSITGCHEQPPKPVQLCKVSLITVITGNHSHLDKEADFAISGWHKWPAECRESSRSIWSWSPHKQPQSQR